MNLNKFTKTQLIEFLESEKAASLKMRAGLWDQIRDLKQELADTEEELALCKGDATESLEQQIAPLTDAITDFEKHLEFEAAFGDLTPETRGTVTDLFRHVAAAADALAPSLRY